MRSTPWILLTLLAACASTTFDVEAIESPQTQATLTAFYEGWEARRDAVRDAVTAAYGAPIEAMDEATYARFLGALDLGTSEGLMTWAAAADVHVVALTRDSDFFYYDAHMLFPEVASTLAHATYASYESAFDPKTGAIVMTDADGNALPVRSVPGVVARLERRGSVRVRKGFAEERLDYDALSRYLAPLSTIPNRDDVANALASLPLFMVKALHGKGFFLSLKPGRSYTISQPVSNEIYTIFAGLMPGSVVEVNGAAQTRETVVHELCHVLDLTAVADRYGDILYPFRYPALAALRAERDALFEPRPGDVSKGYMSAYATANDQEDFAEHCMAFVRKHDAFVARAGAENAAGDDLLERKLAFMTRLFATDAAFVRVSASVIDGLLGSTSRRGLLGSLPRDPSTTPRPAKGCPPLDAACKDAACVADLEEVGDLAAAITATLGGIGATCALASQPDRVSSDGDYYYVADVACVLAAPPTEAHAATFERDMAAAGYDGFALVDGVVKAQTSTRPCSSY